VGSSGCCHLLTSPSGTQAPRPGSRAGEDQTMGRSADAVTECDVNLGGLTGSLKNKRKEGSACASKRGGIAKS